MKGLPILTKMVLLVYFAFTLSAYYAGSTVNRDLIIPHVATAPQLDGSLDAEWTFPDVGMFVYVDNDFPNYGHLDCSSFFRVAYDDDGDLCIYGQVIDDTIYTSGPNPWEQDCFEIYLDGDNSKGSSYDGVDDVQWRYVYGLTEDSAGWKDPGDVAWTTTSNGYALELVISAADLADTNIVLSEGDTIGFEVQVADNDGYGREIMTKWWSQSNNSWQQPFLFGTAILGGDTDDDAQVLEIVEVSGPPTLDGWLDNDWVQYYNVPEVAMTSIADRIFPDGGFDDFSAHFRAAWNADGFYFFGRVVDDSIYTGAPNFYMNDCWEIYFDGGNEKGGSYDGNDVHWSYVYGESAGNPGPGARGTDFEWVTTSNGYNFELVIPTDSLPFVPAAGLVIGFEVQVDDNDGNGRECMTKWWSESNFSWQQPVLFGTAELVSTSTAPPPPPPPGVAEPAVKGLKLSAPSIVGGSASISYTIPARSSVKLTLFNTAGQAVLPLVNEVKDAGTSTTTLDVSGLANGVYLCRLEACNSASTKKVMLIK
jgi:hypothetical protein